MTRLRPAPARLQKELHGVLLTEPQLARRIHAVANQIQADYHGRDLTIVALLNGTVVFLADLIRYLELPVRLDFLGVSSYANRTQAGALRFTKELRLDIKDRDVLVVDDILDTGQTLTRVLEKLRAATPRSLRTCVLLDKPSRRIHALQADYVGFVIPDYFVVGYGLDYAERYRNLPFVGVLKT